MIHQNPKIITQKRAGDPQSPCGGDDKELARKKQDHRNIDGERFGQKRYSGLVCKRLMIEGVAEDSEGENENGKQVAAMTGVVVGQTSDGSVAILFASETDRRMFQNHVPLRATRFHATGLKVIDANEMNSDLLSRNRTEAIWSAIQCTVSQSVAKPSQSHVILLFIW